jgi:hypothetical protein
MPVVLPIGAGLNPAPMGVQIGIQNGFNHLIII